MMNQDYPVSPPDNLPLPDADRRPITPADLELHARWLRRESGGVRLVRVNADLSGADLRRANLSYANLSDGDLSRSLLSGADLSGANLRRANLSYANLSRADLSGANLSRSLLRRANLSGAGLSRANLGYANLSYAHLGYANLSYAHLGYANLSYANLGGANLSYAHLGYANLSYANLGGVQGLPIALDSAERLKAVAKAALQPGALEMNDWHSCGTTHCIAGWAIHLAGEPGRVMQEALGHHLAGMLLLGVEAAGHFYDSNEDARQWLESVAAS